MAAIRPNPTLSDDLISEILVRVPVKSLLCFQSVCKTWLSLIKHPAFVKSQLRHAITTQTDQTLITSLYFPSAETKFALLQVDSRQIVAYPKIPFSQGEFQLVSDCILVGSVDGIVCVAVAHGVAFNYARCKDSIYLWNPAIRQYKLIPSYSVCHDIRSEALGFGYDEVDHDFKVVRVVRFKSPPSFCAEVYSSNTNVWRKVPDPIDIAKMNNFDVCFNGFLCGTGDYGMIAFDLNKEVLNCAIKLPVICDGGYDNPRIIEFNKSIFVIVMMDDELNDDSKIKMWMLDDDACLRGGGVEASWTPIFSISLGRLTEIVHGFFSNGDLLLNILNDHYQYVWIACNVDKKEAKIIPLSIDMNKYIYSYKYIESLVSLAGFKQVNCNVGEDDN